MQPAPVTVYLLEEASGSATLDIKVQLAGGHVHASKPCNSTVTHRCGLRPSLCAHRLLRARCR